MLLQGNVSGRLRIGDKSSGLVGFIWPLHSLVCYCLCKYINEYRKYLLFQWYTHWYDFTLPSIVYFLMVGPCRSRIKCAYNWCSRGCRTRLQWKGWSYGYVIRTDRPWSWWQCISVHHRTPFVSSDQEVIYLYFW